MPKPILRNKYGKNYARKTYMETMPSTTFVQQLDATRLHFIVGAGRSGTTLLSLMLNAHPHISCTPEVKQLLTFYKNYSPQPIVATEQYIANFEQYQAVRYKGKSNKGIFWSFDMPQFIAQLRQYAGRLNYPQVGKLFLRSVKTAQKQDEQIKAIVNKNPDFTFYIPELLRLYPDARIMVSLRDYRAVYLSQKDTKDTNNFSRYMGNNAAAVAYFWELHNAEVLRCLQQYPQQMRLVPYERLVNDKEQMLRELCDFLAIDYRPEMLNPEQHTQDKAAITQQLTDERKHKRKNDFTKQVFTDRLNAWKTQLSATEIATCEAICSAMGKQLGYEPTIQLSAVRRAWLLLSNAPQLLSTYLSYLIFMRWYYHLPLSWRIFMVKYLNIKR